MGERSLRRRGPPSTGYMLRQPGADARCEVEEEEERKDEPKDTAGGQECYLVPHVVVPCPLFPWAVWVSIEGLRRALEQAVPA